jgi:hypothetical protein
MENPRSIYEDQARLSSVRTMRLASFTSTLGALDFGAEIFCNLIAKNNEMDIPAKDLDL